MALTLSDKKFLANLQKKMMKVAKSEDLRPYLDREITIFPISKPSLIKNAEFEIRALIARDIVVINSSDEMPDAEIKNMAKVIGTSIYNELIKTLDNYKPDIKLKFIVRRLSSEEKSKSGVKANVVAYQIEGDGTSKIYDFIQRCARTAAGNGINKSGLRNFVKGTHKIEDGKFYNVGHLYNSTAKFRASMKKYEDIIKFIKMKAREDNNPALKKEADRLKREMQNAMTQPINLVKSHYSKSGIDLGFRRDVRIHKELKSNSTVVVTLQSSAFNQGLASVEKKSTKLFERLITRELADSFDLIISSPTLPKLVADRVLEDTVDTLRIALKQKPKFKNKPYNKKKKTSSKANARGKSSKRPKTQTQVILPPTKSVTEITVELTNVQNIVNQHLPEYLEKNMGKGNSKEVLNWRTGRFGNSAELTNLLQIQGSRNYVLKGLITYLRKPYDVFRPGGKLHKDGRDPKKLIDKSIRQILKEKALVQLSFRSEIK